MNKGFLTFSDDEPGLAMLKDEPDDLTHLAPVAGDVCVPLEDHPFLSDMLDDFLLRDGFCPLLTDEPTDPFISYRSSCDPSPQLLSPNLSKNSDCSLPSLNSPTDSLGDEDQMSTFMSLQMDEDPDLTMKAPYIPMNMGDDLPLLMSDDLMWSSSDKNNSNKSNSENGSSLAQLLSSSVSKCSVKSNDGGGVVIKADLEDFYNEKNHTNWNVSSTKSTQKSERIERTNSSTNSNKRINSSTYDTSNKRTKQEPKEKMSSELLQQLMSNNHNRGRQKGKSNWLLDSGGRKAACISQPSDSVLMNLLDDSTEEVKKKGGTTTLLLSQKDLHTLLKRQEAAPNASARANTIRKNSLSLLDPEGAIPSLLDLTQQDYEVNAPVNSLLLQGEELLTALELNIPM